MDKNGSARKSSNVARKTIEKNRRILTKNLFLQLASSIPSQHNMVSTQLDQLDLAIGYIKELKERIQCMKHNLTMSINGGSKNINNSDEILTCNMSISVLEGDLGCPLELIFIRGLRNNLQLSDVFRVLNEEGLAVINASFLSRRNYTVFITIHTKVLCARIGVELARLRERLNALFS